jgi:hypothetical protein
MGELLEERSWALPCLLPGSLPADAACLPHHRWLMDMKPNDWMVAWLHHRKPTVAATILTY